MSLMVIRQFYGFSNASCLHLCSSLQDFNCHTYVAQSLSDSWASCCLMCCLISFKCHNFHLYPCWCSMCYGPSSVCPVSICHNCHSCKSIMQTVPHGSPRTLVYLMPNAYSIKTAILLKHCTDCNQTL